MVWHIPAIILWKAGVAVAAAVAAHADQKNAHRTAATTVISARDKITNATSRLSSKSDAANKLIAEIQDNITTDYQHIVARVNPVMDCYGGVVREFAEPPIPPGYEAIQNFELPSISLGRLTTEEFKNMIPIALDFGSTVVSAAIATKLHIAMPTFDIRATSMAYSAATRQARQIRLNAAKCEARANEICRDIDYSMTIFDDAVKRAKKAREEFDQHRTFLNRFLVPCEHFLEQNRHPDSLLPDERLLLGYLNTVSSGLEKIATRTLIV